MLGNVLGIYVIASTIEKTLGHAPVAVVFLVGGSVGQYFSVLMRPELVTSGASQALMAICGFTLMAYRQFSVYRHSVLVSAVIVVLQIALDVYVSGSLKPGHGFGLIAGIAMAVIFNGTRSRKRSDV